MWELEAEGGTQIEPLIEQEIKRIPNRTVAGYLQDFEDLRQDLLPQCGIHDLDPSPAGIVRSFEVRVLGDLTGGPAPRASDERLSALVLFLTLEDPRQAEQAIARCEEIPAPPVLTYVWIPRRGLAELAEPLRRYLAIARLLQQQAAGEGVARRLRNEWDKIRRMLRGEIKERLGRIALERGEVAIKRLGDPDEQANVTSWHGFGEYLAERVQARYPKEVKVRSMNANRLYNRDERKINRIENLLHNILNFDDLPPKLRNDLFGERDSSELAALIDGTLGVYSNGLLIERAEGWGLKTPDEAHGPVGELLSLIRDTVLDKRRRKVCEIAELRSKLIAPPFGLPTTVMPVFTAVAIRKDASRLKWVNQTGAFESLLWDAFAVGSTSKLRFDTFKHRQLQVLNALHQVLRLPASASIDPEEQARETVSGLRSYYGGLPDAVKGSARLPEGARDLFQVLKRPGLDSQDVADCLLGLVQGAADADQIRARLQGPFDVIEAIKDERAAAVRQTIAPFMRDRKQRIAETLQREGRADLAAALKRVDQDEPEGLAQVARIVAGKELDRCTDIEIGRLSGDLQRLLERAAQPEPLRPPESGPSAEETFRQELAALIERYQATLAVGRLEAILTSQIEGLGSPAAADAPVG